MRLSWFAFWAAVPELVVLDLASSSGSFDATNGELFTQESGCSHHRSHRAVLPLGNRHSREGTSRMSIKICGIIIQGFAHYNKESGLIII